MRLPSTSTEPVSCSQVEVAAFHNNLDLRVVDLSANPRLEQVQPHAFPRILHLSRLSLASTALRSVRPESVPWQRLTYLDLTNVSLDCSCDLAWLLKAKVVGARCSSPAPLRGFKLSSLRVSGLGCSSGLQTEVAVVGLACLLTLSLLLLTSALCCLCRHKLRPLLATCSVSAQEPPYKVRWRPLSVQYLLSFRTPTTTVFTSARSTATARRTVRGTRHSGWGWWGGPTL